MKDHSLIKLTNIFKEKKPHQDVVVRRAHDGIDFVVTAVTSKSFVILDRHGVECLRQLDSGYYMRPRVVDTTPELPGDKDAKDEL